MNIRNYQHGEIESEDQGAHLVSSSTPFYRQRERECVCVCWIRVDKIRLHRADEIGLDEIK